LKDPLLTFCNLLPLRRAFLRPQLSLRPEGPYQLQPDDDSQEAGPSNPIPKRVTFRNAKTRTFQAGSNALVIRLIREWLRIGLKRKPCLPYTE
jgi:hypothetical protein